MKSRVHPKYKTKYRVANLAGVRALARPTRRRDALALGGGDCRVEAQAVRSTRLAAEVLGPRDRDRIDVAARLRATTSPRGGLPAIGSVSDECRSRRSRSHHALTAKPKPLCRVSPRSGEGTYPSHHRRLGPLDRGEGEWAGVKHGGRGRRGWKKLHLGVDRPGGKLVFLLDR